MSLDLNPDSTIESIQNNFNQAFSLLKLEFFHFPHDEHEGSPKKEMIKDYGTKIGTLTTAATNFHLVFPENMKVSELEQLFEKKLHLHVQVFMKSGNVWLETINSDDKTLLELQGLAKERSTPIEKDTPPDYHEQE